MRVGGDLVTYSRHEPPAKSYSHTLVAEFEAAVRRDHAAGSPSTVRRAEHSDGASNLRLVRLSHHQQRFSSEKKQKQRDTTYRTPTSNLCIIDQILPVHLGPDSCERRVDSPVAHLLLELLRSAGVHVRRNGARVHSVHSSTFGELARPRPSHRLQRRLGAAVDALALKAERGTDAADVDNAATAVVRQVRHGSLHEEKRTADVDVVEVGKVRSVALFNCQVAGDACVLDDDVDLHLVALGVREVVLCNVNDVGGTVFGAHVGLDRDAFDAVCVLEPLGQFPCFLF